MSSIATAAPTRHAIDLASRYDFPSRAFHWGMALCFLLVFAAAGAHYLVPKSPLDGLLWPLHKPTGALLMLLVLLRSLWALKQAGRRPQAFSAASRWGHRALYLLMYAVPVIALLRQYGSGRAFAPFGLPLMAERADDKIGWMIDLGGLLHGELGWVLLALIAGHVAMALWHRRSGHDVLPRMVG